eukprot:767615-Hanusia_phi.AAC.4
MDNLNIRGRGWHYGGDLQVRNRGLGSASGHSRLSHGDWAGAGRATAFRLVALGPCHGMSRSDRDRVSGIGPGVPGCPRAAGGPGPGGGHCPIL